MLLILSLFIEYTSIFAFFGSYNLVPLTKTFEPSHDSSCLKMKICNSHYATHGEQLILNLIQASKDHE